MYQIFTCYDIITKFPFLAFLILIFHQEYLLEEKQVLAGKDLVASGLISGEIIFLSYD